MGSISMKSEGHKCFLMAHTGHDRHRGKSCVKGELAKFTWHDDYAKVKEWDLVWVVGRLPGRDKIAWWALQLSRQVEHLEHLHDTRNNYPLMPETLLVQLSTHARVSSLHSINATWFIDSEHPCHLQLSTKICWLVAHVCVYLPLVILPAYCALFLLTDVIFFFEMTFNII